MTSSTLRRRRMDVGNVAELKNPSLHWLDKNFYLVNQHPKDLISQLPDEILISILERMHTSCAIRTSILSSRWRNLYKQVPKIELNCYGLLRHIPVDCGSSFLSRSSWSNVHNFVSKIEWGIGRVLGCHHVRVPHDPGLVVDSLDRFLSLRSGLKVRSVYLSCCLNNSASKRFEQCAYSIGRLGVENLFLNFSCQDLEIPHVLSFPSGILSKMPSLKYLRLRICSLIPTLRSQCNYSLQILQLDYVTVLPDSLEGILSNCPSLHALSISWCKCPSELSFCGPKLRLKSLEIYRCRNVKGIELYASNLEVLEITTRGVVVNIIFNHVPQLQSVYLSTYEQCVMHYVCGKLSEDVPHLKSFHFSNAGDCFQGSSSSIWTGINRLSNLRRLDLTLKPIPGKNDLLLLAPLLQSCSLLHEFHLHTLLSEHDRPPQEKKKQGIIVFHSELKKVEISGFVGMENDIEFALYILKSATKLEEMHITKCRKIYMGLGRWNPPKYEPSVWSEETYKAILTRLQGQAVSTTAQLIIEHKAQDFKPTPIQGDFYGYVWS